MKSRLIVATLALLVTAGSVFAADDAAKAAKDAKMKEMTAMMKAEMMKCSVCKNMATHMDELAPVMKVEAVKMNDGMAMVHTISDASKLPMFRESCQLTHTAGEAAIGMTDEQAAKELCPFCQELRGIMKSGGHMSMGQTTNGDIMVVTSSDAAVATRISALQEKCAMMMSQMQ